MTQHIINGRKINTHHGRPPIPTTAYDWSATEDSYEPGDLIGYGSTEQSAIGDLLQQIEDDEQDAFETSSAVGS